MSGRVPSADHAQATLGEVNVAPGSMTWSAAVGRWPNHAAQVTDAVALERDAEVAAPGQRCGEHGADGLPAGPSGLKRTYGAASIVGTGRGMCLDQLDPGGEVVVHRCELGAPTAGVVVEARIAATECRRRGGDLVQRDRGSLSVRHLDPLLDHPVVVPPAQGEHHLEWLTGVDQPDRSMLAAVVWPDRSWPSTIEARAEHARSIRDAQRGKRERVLTERGVGERVDLDRERRRVRRHVRSEPQLVESPIGARPRTSTGCRRRAA